MILFRLPLLIEEICALGESFQTGLYNRDFGGTTPC